MTKEEFIKLQSDHVKSGMTLKLYLQQLGTSYTTYNYWRKKYCSSDEQSREIILRALFNTTTLVNCWLHIGLSIVSGTSAGESDVIGHRDHRLRIPDHGRPVNPA